VIFLSLVVLVIALLPTSARAELTRQELKQRVNSHAEWVVDAKISDVFAAYKEYSEVHFTPSRFLWAKGGKTIAELDGDRGEITMRLQDNPFGQGVFFLVELSAMDGKTRVDYWYANSHWRKNGDKLRSLMASTPAAP
jgi:hypothetical protein